MKRFLIVAMIAISALGGGGCSALVAPALAVAISAVSPPKQVETVAPAKNADAAKKEENKGTATK